MRIGIDASNIRAGGGVTHLSEMLRAAEPAAHGISQVIVWGGSTLEHLPDRPWLKKVYEPLLMGNVLKRLLWQLFYLPRLARETCDLLFIPGGSFFGGFQPNVVMAQNLLPFDAKSRALFGFSLTRLRLYILNRGQTAAFRRADGIIFMTEATAESIEHATGPLTAQKKVIYHGIDDSFRCKPRTQIPVDEYGKERPFRWLYVSIINHYKHQWHVVEAVSMLREEGFPITLDLVGPSYPPALKRLHRSIQAFDPRGEFITYQGAEPYARIAQRYSDADGFVFASSCETISIILMEAMAAGLPIACSNVMPLPEVLEEGGVYFDPEQPAAIAAALRSLMLDSKARQKRAELAYNRVKQFTWKQCAEDTFAFLSSTAGNYRSSRAADAPKDKEMESAVIFHESIADIWAAKYGKPSFARRAAAIMSILEADDLEGKRWLDAGCGAGVLSLLLAEKGARVIGVDGSPSMVNEAKLLADGAPLSHGNRPEYRVIPTVENLDCFEDGMFDGILCSSVLEYLDKPSACLHEMWRVLKPGGTLLITIPNKMSFVRNLQKLMYRLTSLFLNQAWPEYICHSINDYTPGSCREVLRYGGFRVKKASYYGPGKLSRFVSPLFGGSLLIVLAEKTADVAPLIELL